MLLRRLLHGPIRDRWASLNFSPDAAQNRAVGILDQLSESTLKFHRSSTAGHVGGPQFDLSPFRESPNVTTEESHEQVAQYTRNLAEENKRLLAKQRGKSITRESRNWIQPNTQTYHPPQASAVHPVTPVTPVPSVYLFGSVGRGKTVLLNILCDQVAVRSRRYHFFDLMKKVHSEMISGKRISDIANELADDCDILFLDEIAIVDIQDATILPIFMHVLLTRQVALIMTSNQHPQALYTNGLNRHIYLPPFLKLLKESGCRIVSLDDDENVDYRTLAGEQNRVCRWTSPLSSQKKNFEKISIALSPTRFLELEKFPDGVLSTSTSYLVNSDQFSDSDFIKLADFVDSKSVLRIVVDSKFSAADILGSARRFGKLVEILYDKKTNVEFVSSVDISDLFEKSSTEDLIAKGFVGEAKESVASPLAAAAVDEGFRSLDRCFSRLAQAVKL